jgi:hypothetical protein
MLVSAAERVAEGEGMWGEGRQEVCDLHCQQSGVWTRLPVPLEGPHSCLLGTADYGKLCSGTWWDAKRVRSVLVERGRRLGA